MPAAGARCVLATRNAHKLREFGRLLAPAGCRSSRCRTRSCCRPRSATRSPPTRCRRRGPRRRRPAARRSPTTRGSRRRRWAARPACARPGSPASTPPTRRTSTCCAHGAGRQRAALRLRAGLRRSGERARADVLRLLHAGRWRPSRAASGGFGYDPAFLPDAERSGRTMAELTDAEKDRISHRGAAVRELLAWLARARDVTAGAGRARRRSRRQVRLIAGRDGDGERHLGVAVVAIDEQDRDRDQTRQHGADPGDAAEFHDRDCGAPVRRQRCRSIADRPGLAGFARHRRAVRNFANCGNSSDRAGQASGECGDNGTRL